MVFGTDWEHFTLSAQLGPVCESRAAASEGGGPLNKTQSRIHDYKNANKNLNINVPLLSTQEIAWQCTGPQVSVMINIHFLPHPITEHCAY